MDIPPLLLEDLDALALRLEGLADDVDGLVARTAHGTSRSWRGPAADRHRELVAARAADLTALGAALRGAAAAVRVVAAAASEHFAALGDPATARIPRPDPALP